MEKINIEEINKDLDKILEVSDEKEIVMLLSSKGIRGYVLKPMVYYDTVAKYTPINPDLKELKNCYDHAPDDIGFKIPGSEKWHGFLNVRNKKNK
ncbi:hypothetical protein [Treponema sp.]|uniref:hypothetical protein n=1 Tax=Treponema sp. TaxID=166 RepID=UPI0025D4A2BB|nr:hypothetical protein [Treponema sp.]MCR5217490.1 hypothetical protein [Treponema sp.]